MVNRIGWALYLAGLASTAAGLFAFPWLASGSHGCNAVAGTSCTISDANSTAALLLGIAAAIGVWRALSGPGSLASCIFLAASGIGIAFSVFTFNYDAFSGPEMVFRTIPTAAQMRALMRLDDWHPSSGFALSLLGGALLVVAAVVWSSRTTAAMRSDRRTRRLVGALGAGSALLAALGASLPWVHVAPASAVIDTDTSAVSAAAAVLIVAAVGYMAVGGRGWSTAFCRNGSRCDGRQRMPRVS